MTLSASSIDTHNAVVSAHTDAHALKSKLDGYVTVLAGEGASEASSVCAAMSAALVSSLAQLDVLKQALDDNVAQNT